MTPIPNQSESKGKCCDNGNFNDDHACLKKGHPRNRACCGSYAYGKHKKNCLEYLCLVNSKRPKIAECKCGVADCGDIIKRCNVPEEENKSPCCDAEIVTNHLRNGNKWEIFKTCWKCGNHLIDKG